MDMSKEDITEYVAMQGPTDSIKYVDIQPSPYESPYQQDIYQEQGTHREPENQMSRHILQTKLSSKRTKATACWLLLTNACI